MTPLSIQLRDINASVCYAWQEAFADISNVNIAHGDIFGSSADAIISPANSFGFMDGGIDLVYLRRFGQQLQAQLQDELRRRFNGEMPVGMAHVVETGDANIPYL
jgi:O-acetyl-ADP-ribose deacetylase (regulator of RNase III)